MRPVRHRADVRNIQMVSWGCDHGSCDKGQRNVSAGMLVSKQSFGYGYYELEAKMAADTPNIVSAFWLQSNRAEIDIIHSTAVLTEEGDLAQQMKTSFMCWNNDDNGGEGTFDEVSDSLPVEREMDLDHAAFHSYGLLWSDDGLHYFIDGTYAPGLHCLTSLS